MFKINLPTKANLMSRVLAKIKASLKFARHEVRIVLARIKGRYGKKIFSGSKGNELIAIALTGQAPFMAARIGSGELECISFYFKNRKTAKVPYPEEIKKKMHDNAGFFPADDESLDKFSEIFLESLKKTDLLAVWFNQNEDLICREFCPGAQFSELKSLEPYYWPKPWSAALAGKKVLVVHPFVQTISSQYQNKRKLIFANPAVLPKFTLKTVRTVLSLGDEKTQFTDWFAALASMEKAIAAEDFDVAIIGAGAYGLPLAAYVKSLGKQAVHMGGATQILFGIKGKRWDKAPFISRLYNENWVRPTAEETPRGAEKVEGATYW